MATLSKSKLYPEIQATLDGLRRPVQHRNLFMEDLDNNQFQIANILYDIANDTVATLGVENVAYNENKNMHRKNNREWADEQRHKIVEIDIERKGWGKTKKAREKHFMRRVKER